jgi:hypothetical protein
MTFFYDLNKKLADLAKRQDLNESVGSTSGFLEASTGDYSAKKARAGKDIGKPGKMFSKIAKSAGERYGSKERGEKVAGAVLAKLRAKESVEESDMDESALQAYLGKKKYGDAGMKALQKAGREGASKETMARIRAKHDKMDEQMADEGNEFSGELVKARAQGAKSFEVDGKSYPVKEAAKPDYIDLDRDGNRKESMKKAAADAKKKKMSEADPVGLEEKKKEPRSKGTAFDPEVAKTMISKDDHPRYDVKDTGYSKRYTRKPEPEAEKDDEATSDAPKKKGRPKGPAKGPERTTKGAWKHKGSRKEKTEEDLDTDGVMMNRPSNMSSEDIESIALVDKGEYDREGDMAKEQLHTIKLAAKELASILSDDENLPEWVQSKITKAMDYIDTARDYMISTKADNMQPVAEKAVSVAQRRAAGIAHAAQKGEIPKKELRGASKEMAKMPAGELKKFAKTKEKGLPEKVKEADAEAKPAKKGGFEFGKGVYESMDMKLNQILAEGMNISVNMNTGPDGQPSKNITVSADGDDAEALAALLKMAGINSGNDACSGCGKTPCGCEELDENSPDWPTNTETSDNALQYSGGLNGPKSTKQGTLTGGGLPTMSPSRQVSMEESVELERDLFRLYQNYKAQ